MIQRDWSQEDSTGNEMRMHAVILLLLSTSMNDDVDDSSSMSIPHRCGAGHETDCRHTMLCPTLHSLDSYALLFQPIVALLTACSQQERSKTPDVGGGDGQDAPDRE
jgi:hypothetical protein